MFNHHSTVDQPTSETPTRRQALTRIALGGSAIVAAAVPRASFGQSRSQGGNDRIRIGLIGCGVRGKYLIANLPDDGQIVSLCDCSLGQIATTRQPTGVFQAPLAKFAAGDGPRCSIYQDYRVMLEREELDAVVIAAPDHHHALPMILACQRGCDVYVEKPLALTIAEGRAMVEAAKKHQRIVQVGSQQRTMEVNRFACQFVRDGGLGKVSLVQTRNFPGPMRNESFPRRPQQEVPRDLDWNLFCGPTPLREYHQDLWMKDAYTYGYLTWRGWDLFRTYSGHLMTNWGGHSIDMIQFALGADASGPVDIEVNPQLIDKYIDDAWHEKTPPLGSVPDEREDRMRFCPVTMRYAHGPELRFDPSVQLTVFHGTRGKLFLSRNLYYTEPAGLAPPLDKNEQAKWIGEGHVVRPHLLNWLNCIRRREQPNAPVEAGHRTATVCHLANIARELGRSLRWDPIAERFDTEQPNTLLTRPRRDGFELPS